MVVLGIDYGAKRVGLALALEDEMPQRFKVVANDDGLMACLVELAEDHDIDTVVVGLPRNLDGDDTAQTQEVREFADQLADAFDCEVVLQDEADTSNIARQRLQMAKLPPVEVERLVDAEAATIILEDYLAQT
jgi:putative Holliday junction resolvase